MVPANFERALREFTQRQQFRPFSIELFTGHTIRVRHPEAVIMPGRVAVYIRRDSGYELFDGMSASRCYDDH
jgi:hypothetical protein